MGKIDGFGMALMNDTVEAASPTSFPPVTSMEMAAQIAEMTHEATLGGRFPEALKRGARTYAGPANFGARPGSLPYFLSMAMGNPVTTRVGTVWSSGQTYTLGQLIIHTSPTTKVFEVTTAGTGGTTVPSDAGAVGSTIAATSGTAVFTIRDAIYKHTYSPATSGLLPTPATLWKIIKDVNQPGLGTADLVDRYGWGYLNELGLSIEPNNYLLGSAGLVAKRLTDLAGVAPAITRDASELWSFSEVSAKLGVNGAAVADHILTNFNMTYSNNFNTDNFQLGSLETSAIRPGNVGLGVGFSAAQSLEAHYRRALQNNPDSVQLTLVGKGKALQSTINATTAYEEFGLDFKRLQYTEAPLNIDAANVLTQVAISSNGVLTPAGAFLDIYVVNTNNGLTYVKPA
jgi:hypothetical protein